MPAATAELLERFARRDRRALAALLTRVESGEQVAPAPDNSSIAGAKVVGITGSGGAGKSTLIGALIRHLRGREQSVAVLACDPQSPLTGGALLGDRIRIEFDPADEGVYFRSMSTRGASDGVSAATAPAVALLKAFGFDVILLESVGVGQDQVGLHGLVDCLVLLVTPGTGDEVQWEKAGLIEVADLVVVNKCDMPGADRVRSQLASTLSLAPAGNAAPVIGVTAVSGEGVAELWTAVEAHIKN